jgi:hypothetical protein
MNRNELMASSDEFADMLDTLEWVLWQACGPTRRGGPDELDSMALSAYADGIRLLAKHDRVRITAQHGRRVIAVRGKAGE